MQIINEGDCVTALLEGDIDHHALFDVRSEIDTALDFSSPKTLVLDFEKVSFMDSSGIGLILGRKRKLDEFGGKLCIRNANPYLSKIIKLAGLKQML